MRTFYREWHSDGGVTHMYTHKGGFTEVVANLHLHECPYIWVVCRDGSVVKRYITVQFDGQGNMHRPDRP